MPMFSKASQVPPARSMQISPGRFTTSSSASGYCSAILNNGARTERSTLNPGRTASVSTAVLVLSGRIDSREIEVGLQQDRSGGALAHVQARADPDRLL